MTFDDLRSFLEKKNRKCAILDADFKLLWDKDGFFGAWKIKFPQKEDFSGRKEVIIAIGTDKAKIPVSVTKISLGGEVRYVCEAFDRETLSELTAKSEVAELLRNYLAGINDKIHVMQFLADQVTQNPIVQSDGELLGNCRKQTGAAFDLLALSTNLNYYFNNFTYTASDNKIDVLGTIDGLIKKSNEFLGSNIIELKSKSSRASKTGQCIAMPERVFTVVFLNLIQNALLYSKPDSKVEVKVFYTDTDATISVTNETTDTVPASESRRLGIGLPLVERILNGTGGKVVIERAGNTYKAHITLPVYAQEEAVLKVNDAPFISQNTSYVRRYLNQFIET